MDRRVLVIVALVATAAAVGLGFVLGPDTDVAPAAPPPPVAPVAMPTAQPVPSTARVQTPRRAPSPPSRLPATDRPRAQAVTGTRPVLSASGKTPIPAEAVPVSEQQREYRCRALGQQADLIDRLMVIAGGGAVEDHQRAEMVSRVARMSTQVFDEGEQLWSGSLSCEGVSDVNLGPASDFLFQMRDELELDDKTRTEVNQALGVLETVDWPEGEGE